MQNKKLIIIVSLIVTLLIMAGGYAIYSAQLKISGTGTIDSNFSIEVTGITEESKSGKAVSVTEPTYTSTTASFNTKLQRAGDNIEYLVEITNNGSINGKINQITITNPNEIVKVETRGLIEGEIIKAGEVKEYIVRIYIPENATITEDVTSVVEVSAEITQDDNQIFNEEIDGIQADQLVIEKTREESSYTSIKCIVTAKGNGLRYSYSLDGKTWTSPTLTNSHTFENLEIGTRYSVYYKVEDANNNYVTESNWVTTKDITEPIINVEDEDTWAASKEVTITYPELEAARYYYRVVNSDEISTINDEEGWIETQNLITTINVNKNSIISARIVLNEVTQETYKEITTIDGDEPSLNLNITKTSNIITVVADANAISGIKKYEYSNDGGITWIDNTNYNNYTFTNLKHGTEYPIKVRVTSGVGNETVESASVITTNIQTPSFKELGAGIVEVTFPNGCLDEYVCTYIKNDDQEISVTEQVIILEFETNGTIIAKVNDGVNYINSNVYTVIVKKEHNFSVTNNSQTFTVPKDGYYEVETYGASSSGAAKGAYAKGEIYLEKGETIYIYVGQNGSSVRNATSFNGGTSTSDGLAGGGATDVRLVSGEWNNANSLRSRIMVAGGSGASSGLTVGSGGDLLGLNGNSATGGTQTSGGIQDSGFGNGGFGYGGGGCGGGGGYYGGGGALCSTGGGGGSSYISGYAGVNSIASKIDGTHTNGTNHYSGKYFINTEMKPSINSGDGTAKITYIGNPSSEDSTKIRNVRYIKDCVNGSTAGVNSHWVEIQAINKGINVAKDKTVSANFGECTLHGTGTFNTIVDGIADNSSLYYDDCGYDNDTSCVTVDLGREYDLEEIAVWHYYGDGRTYYDNETFVAGKEAVYREVYSGEKTEVTQGNRIKTDTYTPVFTEDRQQGEAYVTITYPSGCTEYTCSYIRDDEEEVIVTENSVTLQFVENGNIIAKVKSGNVFVASATYTVTYNGAIDSVVPTDSMLFWGQANNPANTNQILSDMSGNNNDGTLSGFEQTKSSGYNGTDLIFDGSNDYVNLGFAGYDFKNTYSMVMYVKVNDDSSYQPLFGNWESAGFGLESNFSAAPNGIGIESYAESSYTVVPASETTNLRNYYTIVATYDGTNIKVYLDGNMVANKTSSKLTNSPVNMLIGGNPNSTGAAEEWAEMAIKEVMLYDRALTADEVTSITSGFEEKYGEIAFNDKMLSYLNANDIVGNTWTDQSSMNNNGILYNFNGTESSGKNGDEIVFDGTDDYVNLGLDTHAFEGHMTIAARIKYLTSVTSTESIGNWDSGGGGIGLSGGSFFFNAYHGNDYPVVYSEDKMVVEQYYNVIAVDNGYELKIYIDGKLSGTTSYSGDPVDSFVKFILGGNPNASGIDGYSSSFAVKKFLLFDKGVKPNNISKLNQMLFMPDEKSLEKPTFTTDSSNITINYPEECSNGTLTCTYSLDDGSSVAVADTTVTLSLNDFGKVLAKVTDGISSASNVYINQYTITWNASSGGGSVNGSSSVSTTQKYNANIVLPSYTPVRENYLFTGWYTAASGGTKITSSTKFTTQGNVTYYAQFSYAVYTAYGGIDGTTNSKFRAVAQARVTSQNNSQAYLQYRYYVEVTQGNFNSSTFKRSWGSNFTVSGTGTYADTGWTNYGWVSYGSSVTFSANAYYTRSSGGTPSSTASVTVTPYSAY